MQFERTKIEKAIKKANNSVSKREQLNEVQIRNIALEVEINFIPFAMVKTISSATKSRHASGSRLRAMCTLAGIPA